MKTPRYRLAVLAALLMLTAACATTPPVLPPIGDGGPPLPGKFVWFDLITDDLIATRSFYSQVFGWQFRDAAPDSSDYVLIHNANRDIGGAVLHKQASAKVGGARWLALISVADMDQALRRVEQQGGKVVAPPKAVPRRGTHALVRDAEGAYFGLLRSDSGDPADKPVDDGDFFWADLLAREPAHAAEFYRAVAGYDVSNEQIGRGIDRIVLSSGGYARAGIAPLPAAVKQPGWLPYVLVADVPGTVKKVSAAGGRVLVEPRAELLDGNLAVIADPRGGVLGIVNWIAPGKNGGTP